MKNVDKRYFLLYNILYKRRIIMRLTSEYALNLLNKIKPEIIDVRWINHSICVGNTAAIIAKELNLNPEYARALGYVHDIGKYINKTNYEWHDIDGYNYLISLGIDKEDAMICLTHSYINGDYTCTAGGIPQNHKLRNDLKEYEYNYYQKIINLCDLMCTTQTMSMEKRLIDLLLRKGIHENTKYHIESSQKLKAEFDALLGFDLYLLFPEITGIKNVYLCSSNEYDTNLSIDNKANIFKSHAESNINKLTKEQGGNWKIMTLPVKYN